MRADPSHCLTSPAQPPSDNTVAALPLEANLKLIDKLVAMAEL